MRAADDGLDVVVAVALGAIAAILVLALILLAGPSLPLWEAGLFLFGLGALIGHLVGDRLAYRRGRRDEAQRPDHVRIIVNGDAQEVANAARAHFPRRDRQAP